MPFNQRFLILLLVLPLGLIAQTEENSTEIITLEEIWKQVDENNEELQQSQLRIQEQSSRIQQAKNERIPMIEVDANIHLKSNMPVYVNGLFHKSEYFPASNYGYGFGGALDWTIYQGGQLNRAIEKQKTQLHQNELETEAHQNSLHYLAAENYYELYRFSIFKSLLDKEINTREKQLQHIKNLFRHGVVLKSDTLRAAVKVSQLRLTKEAIRKKITIAKQRLNVLMNKEYDQPIAIDTNPLQNNSLGNELLTEKDFMDLALQKSPDYKLSLGDVKLSEIDLKQIKSQILPRVSAFAGYDYSYPQNRFYPYSSELYGLGQVGVKLQFSIDELFKNKQKRNEYQFRLEEQKLGVSSQKDELATRIKEAFLNYQQAQLAVQTAQETILQSEESLRVIQNSYNNQESLLTDLLNAEDELLQSKFELTNAQVQQRLTYIKLLELTGII